MGVNFLPDQVKVQRYRPERVANFMRDQAPSSRPQRDARLELGVFQPFALPSPLAARRSALDCLLKVVMRTVNAVSTDDDEKNTKA
jgi:hypothetical protein